MATTQAEDQYGFELYEERHKLERDDKDVILYTLQGFRVSGSLEGSWDLASRLKVVLISYKYLIWGDK